MGVKYRRTFIGYKPKDVEKKLLSQEKQFQELYSNYNSELAKLLEENKTLLEKIYNTKKEMSKNQTRKEEFEKNLIRKHMDSSRIIYDLNEKLKDMVKYKTNILEMQQNKNEKIKKSINNLLEKIQTIVKEEV